VVSGLLLGWPPYRLYFDGVNGSFLLWFSGRYGLKRGEGDGMMILIPLAPSPVKGSTSG
jgi:hypothetical protein